MNDFVFAMTKTVYTRGVTIPIGYVPLVVKREARVSAEWGVTNRPSQLRVSETIREAMKALGLTGKVAKRQDDF